MKKRAAGILILSCHGVFSQVTAPPAFEVASIRPSMDVPGSSVGIFESPGRISAKNVTLKRCVRGAYDIEESRILGGPDWVNEDRYSIEAKAAGPAGDHEMMLMLRTLLSERFRLVLDREQRIVSGYRLKIAKGGLSAKASAIDSRSSGNARRGRIEAESYTISQFAMKLAEALREPVLDTTGVEGRFDFKLDWTPDETELRRAAADLPAAATTEYPDIFTALQQQIGLKLEAGRIPAEVLVIDSAVRPSPN